jgi:hypothetical protein
MSNESTPAQLTVGALREILDTADENATVVLKVPPGFSGDGQFSLLLNVEVSASGPVVRILPASREEDKPAALASSAIAEEDAVGVRLRLSAQRALWGNVPPTLRSVSLEQRGNTIHFRAVFTSAATEDDRELLAVVAAEVIADFSAPTTIEEEFIDLDPPAKPPRFKYLVFLRAER